MHHIKINDFERLREELIDARYDLMENCISSLEEASEFDKGRFYGEYLVYDEIIGVLRNILKYNELPEDQVYTQNLNE